MPTETFFKLSEEKKNKIILAAKKELANVNVEEISIKNIVEEAEIARGSFYQYFESKEDLIMYLIQNQMKILKEEIDKNLSNTDGDITHVFITIYDSIINQIIEHKDKKIYAKIFSNIKAGEDNYFWRKNNIQNECKHYEFCEKYIKKDTLNIKSQEDFEIIINIMYAIISSSIGHVIKTREFEKERNNLIKKLEYIKKGIEK